MRRDFSPALGHSAPDSPTGRLTPTLAMPASGFTEIQQVLLEMKIAVGESLHALYRARKDQARCELERQRQLFMQEVGEA